MAEPGKIEDLIKSHAGKILGYLIRLLGNFDDAEDLHQEVLLKALVHWRAQGLPQEPLAWLFMTAKNLAIDHLRRHQTAEKNLQKLQIESPQGDELTGYLEDDLLRLIFTCSHPSLNDETRVSLTLRSVAGLRLSEVANAFLVSPSTMEQRLVRAKRKIKLAGIPFEIPTGQQIAVRLHGVLQTVYLLFNEGYSASSGASLVNVSICDEALGLGKLLVDLFPGNAEVLALLALMLLQDSRRDARSTDTGALVLLKDQNRTNWNHDQIKLGLEILDQSLGLKQRPAFFQLQATIAALHAQAESFEKTDWAEIGLVYQVLLKHVPVKSDAVVIWLNYAVVLAMQGQFQEGLSLLTELQPGLLNYHPYYLARAELQLMATEAGDPGISIDTSPEEDLEKALSLTRNDAERQYLQARLKQIRQKKG